LNYLVNNCRGPINRAHKYIPRSIFKLLLYRSIRKEIEAQIESGRSATHETNCGAATVGFLQIFSRQDLPSLGIQICNSSAREVGKASPQLNSKIE